MARKWDGMGYMFFSRENVCFLGYSQVRVNFMIFYTLKGCKNTYKAHLTLNYCVCMRLKDILNSHSNLQAVI